MDGSYKSRRKRGLDVFRTIRNIPSPDLEQTAGNMASAMGPVASFCIDHVFGDIWSRPELSRRDRSLVAVAALACIGGAQAELQTHLGGALNHGVTVEELEELMLHLCGYAGYPRGIDGMRLAMVVFSEREDTERPLPRPGAEPKDDRQRICDGAEVIRGIMGWKVSEDAVAGIMEEQLGLLGRFGLQHIMGEIWARPQLGRRDRSLITLVALISLGKLAELRIHVPAALRHGMTRDEVDEVILQLTLYLGYPAAVEAKNMTREILEELEEGDSPG